MFLAAFQNLFFGQKSLRPESIAFSTGTFQIFERLPTFNKFDLA